LQQKEKPISRSIICTKRWFFTNSRLVNYFWICATLCLRIPVTQSIIFGSLIWCVDSWHEF
jgi:hypothetical protein